MLATMALDCGNTSITYEQQARTTVGFAGGHMDWRRIFDGGLLTEAGVRKRLAELGTLSPDWDGEGANSLSDLTLRNTRKMALLLAQHTHVPDISPNPGDTISCEWETEAGSALMEIGHSTYSFLMKTKAGKRSTETGSLDREDDIATLGRLINRSLY